MKNILIILTVAVILGFTSNSYAVFMPLKKTQYLAQLFTERVEELIKVELSKSIDNNDQKKEYLLKNFANFSTKKQKKSKLA